ncbi:MAG: hypothetical protein KGH64_00570 [Candidatus Micrarchaeota archaeon]|nr:hypothetical protein [Candidatus Micrarchaeota archaeon]
MKFDKQFVGLLTNEERAELKAALEQSETEPVMRVLPNGDKEWRLPNGQLHRTDGPALEYADGDKFWYLNGQRHRTDGPAVEYANGGKYWYLNDRLHRTDGPAIECANGTKFWYLNDQRHRTDGPAVEYADGGKAWYLNGQQVTEAEVIKNSCNGKIVEIEGKKYKLMEA